MAEPWNASKSDWQEAAIQYAVEIERLRAQNAAMLEALREIAAYDTGMAPDFSNAAKQAAIARAAIAAATGERRSMGEPQFDRMIDDIQRAKAAYEEGNYELCRRLLKVVASIAYADSVERGPNDPVPEVLGAANR